MEGIQESEHGDAQERWKNAFDTFLDFVEEAGDMARLVRRSVTNNASMDEAVEKAVAAEFPTIFVNQRGKVLRSIVRHAVEFRSTVREPGSEFEDFSESLSLEVSEMVEEELPKASKSTRELIILPLIERAVASAERRIGGPRLYVGLLLQLESAFEVFVGELMVETCLLHPIDYDLKTLGLSSREIARAVGEEGVERLFAEREAATVLARSFDSWIEWFRKPPRRILSTAELSGFEGVLKFHLIRNVWAHGNGAPQRRHAQQMAALNISLDDFALSEESFRVACRNYASLGFSLWALIGDKLFGKHGFPSVLSQVQVKLLKSSHIEALALLDHEQLSSSTADEVRVNWWLAELRARSSWDEESSVRHPDIVREDVMAWQPNGNEGNRNDILSIAKDVLLGKKQSAAEKTRAMIEAGKLTRFLVQEWPLFQEIGNYNLLDSDGSEWG